MKKLQILLIPFLIYLLMPIQVLAQSNEGVDLFCPGGAQKKVSKDGHWDIIEEMGKGLDFNTAEAIANSIDCKTKMSADACSKAIAEAQSRALSRCNVVLERKKKTINCPDKGIIPNSKPPEWEECIEDDSSLPCEAEGPEDCEYSAQSVKVIVKKPFPLPSAVTWSVVCAASYTSDAVGLFKKQCSL